MPSGAHADESKAKTLATAMSLYSNNLSGIIMTVDNRISSYTGIKKKFAEVCEQVGRRKRVGTRLKSCSLSVSYCFYAYPVYGPALS